MKIYLLIFLTLFSIAAHAQQDTTRTSYFQRHCVLATASLGFIDPYRQYSIPADFQKNNTSGYTLIYAKVEYALTHNIGLAATAAYDAFVYNFSQLYTGFNGPIKRYKVDNLRIFDAGISAYYHLGQVIHIKRLDPFACVGVTISNIRQSAYPTGDSTAIKLDHRVFPVGKIGARYYISNRFSLFGDLGYDNQSIFSIGFSCRFLPRKQSQP